MCTNEIMHIGTRHCFHVSTRARMDGSGRPLSAALPLPAGLSSATSQPHELYDRHTAKLIPDDRVGHGAHHNHHVVLRVASARYRRHHHHYHCGTTRVRRRKDGATHLVDGGSDMEVRRVPSPNKRQVFLLEESAQVSQLHIHTAPIARRLVGANRVGAN